MPLVSGADKPTEEHWQKADTRPSLDKPENFTPMGGFSLAMLGATPDIRTIDEAAINVAAIEGTVMMHQSQIVILRWMLGRIVYIITRGDGSTYGDGVVNSLSSRTGIGVNILRISRRLYEHFRGHEQDFVNWVNDHTRNWYEVEGLLRTNTDKKVLGEERFIERLKRRVERLLHDMDDISGLADAGDDEAVGILVAAAEEVSRLRRALATGNKPKTPRSDDYLMFVRGLPCYICNTDPPSDPHHVEQGTTKGSDGSCIPLCRECHRFLEDNGHAKAEKELHFSVAAAIATTLHEYLFGCVVRFPSDISRNWGTHAT